MLLLPLCLWLVSLQGVLAVIYAPQFDRTYGVNEREKYILEKRKTGPTTSSGTAIKKPGNTKEDPKKTAASGPSQEDWRLWDEYEEIYRNKYKVPSLHFAIPLPGTSPSIPIPGQNGSNHKKKDKAPSPAALHIRASSGGGSNPLPFPVPGIPNPHINTEPVPGNGQPPLDPMEPTPLNPNIPSVDRLIQWLNERYPNGRGHPRSPDIDIRYQLMFWSGGPPRRAAREARETAASLNLFVLADLFMSDWRNSFVSPWTEFVRQTTPRTFDDTRPMWRRMGLAMASWARGTVRFRVYDDASATRVDSTWNAVERPELENRGLTIQFVDRSGTNRQPIYPPVQQNPQTPPNGTGPQAPQKKDIPGAKQPGIPRADTGAKNAKLSRRTVQAILRRDRMLRLTARHLERKARGEKLAMIRRAVERAGAVAARDGAAFEMNQHE